MGPLLMPRRQTLESPRMSASATPTPRRPFDEPLSSNASVSASGSAAVTGSAGSDSSRLHSQSPATTPPSRSSTTHPSVKPHDGNASSAGHTPPPTTSASTGSSARGQA